MEVQIVVVEVVSTRCGKKGCCRVVSWSPRVPPDDRPGTSPPPGSLLQRPLEHPGLHRGQRSAGRIRLLVSLYSTSNVPITVMIVQRKTLKL